MSALENDEIGLIKLEARELLMGEKKIEGFKRMGESLKLQLPLAQANLRIKQEAFGDLHSPRELYGRLRSIFFFERARRELHEAKYRVKYITDSILLHDTIVRKISSDECCCAQHLELLLRFFIRHMETEQKLFEDIPNSSLPLICQKAYELKQFIEEIACFKSGAAEVAA
jgi:hypothetical protein